MKINREIKFRGKHSNKWIYGYLTKEEQKYHITEDSVTFYQVKEETIGQYTGLKDKNGVEIYEGDILRFTANRWNNPMEYPVVYNVAQAKFVIDAKFKKFGIANGNVEVIGNIYDELKDSDD